jgi:cysteine desulfurase
LPNNVHITIPGTDNERVMMQLDELGIMCAVGSACSASNEEPSHVLKAIGLTDKDAQSSLRFTMGRSTKRGEIDKTIQKLASIL